MEWEWEQSSIPYFAREVDLWGSKAIENTLLAHYVILLNIKSPYMPLLFFSPKISSRDPEDLNY